jgi:hypothetical protein
MLVFAPDLAVVKYHFAVGKSVALGLCGGVAGALAMLAFGPALVLRTVVAVLFALVAAVASPPSLRGVSLGIALGTAGGLTLLIGAVLLGHGFAEDTAAAALVFALSGAAAAGIAGWSRRHSIG